MLQLNGLVRRFGDTLAVDQVSLSVGAGELVGFVGGNGAGKTTTMRMIMGVLAADAGEVLWDGRPATIADRRHFGYMPEERGLYPQQGVLGQLVHLGRLQGLEKARAVAVALDYLERFGLADRAEDKLASLSLGNQQRVQIAAALVAGPGLLVLDEPFSGLDPGAVDAMAALLREQAAQGVGILFSSHQLEIVERLCDRLVVMAHGRVVADGTPEELRHSGDVRHRLVMAAGGDGLDWVRELPYLDVLDLGEEHATVHLREPADADRLLRAALARGEVRELTQVVPSVVDVFREVAA